jgi:hypothetical protein
VRIKISGILPPGAHFSKWSTFSTAVFHLPKKIVTSALQTPEINQWLPFKNKNSRSI